MSPFALKHKALQGRLLDFEFYKNKYFISIGALLKLLMGGGGSKRGRNHLTLYMDGPYNHIHFQYGGMSCQHVNTKSNKTEHAVQYYAAGKAELKHC